MRVLSPRAGSAAECGTTYCGGARQVKRVVVPWGVLDLAFLLPALLALSWLLLRRQSGILFAVPMMTFTADMGSAIIVMVAVTLHRGLPGSWALAIFMAINIAIAAVIGGVFLKRLSKA